MEILENLQVTFQSNIQVEIKIGVKIVKFTSNHKKKYLHLEDELK